MYTGVIPHYGAEEIHRALDWNALVAALREAFRAPAEAPLRHVHTVKRDEDARLLLMPAWREGREIGVKLVSVFPRNRERGAATVSALYVLLDGRTGTPRALLDGEALTLRRTAATSALASLHLARAESRTLLVVGTGRLAPFMAQAHCAVRRLERVLIWGRSPARAAAVAARLVAAGVAVEAVADLPAALAAADIVSCATTAREPVLRGAWLRPGTHLDLVGAFTPAMRESDDALIARAEIFVDTFAGALAEAGDLLQPLAHGVISRADIRAELADLVCARHPGRSDPQSVTLFKSVGAALEDLCAARLAVERLAPR